MAINLADKYGKKVEERFNLDSVIAGKFSNDYDWDGVKSIKIYDVETYEPNDYNRTATGNRYGTPKEVQDDLQIMTITQDKSNSLTVDKGNNTEQMMIKNAAKVAKRQVRERYVPLRDKYCLNAWANFTCKSADEKTTYTVQSAVDSSVTESNIVKLLAKARAALVNKKVPMTNVFCYMGATNFALLAEAPTFQNLEKLGTKAVEAGVVGKCKGFKIVEVPDEYMPTDVNFMVVNKDAVLAPLKINDMNLHQNPPGLSGHQLDFRWIFDAFVKKTKVDGIYVSRSKAAA